jgi:hypothetical protein
MTRTVPALLTTTAVLLLAHGEADAVCSRTPRALRIMSWNVACTSGGQSMEDVLGASDLQRMYVIGMKIKEWDPDVVALYEVFDDHVCKDYLLEMLGELYPNRIEEIDDQSMWEDSGLMLFSKLPFLEFPADVYFNNTDFEINGLNAGVSWDERNAGGKYRTIAIHAYTPDECKGQDCHFEKAAAMVRVSGGTSCPINIAFTQPVLLHEDDDVDERNDRMERQRRSLESIRDMILGSLTNTQLAGEPLFVMGDLGIDGNIGPDGDVKDPDTADADFHPLVWPDQSPRTLWEMIFDPFWNDTNLLAAGFYGCGAAGVDGSGGCAFNGGSVTHLLTDTAAFEHPRTDLFQTAGSPAGNPDYLDGDISDEDFVDLGFAGGSGFRFDYILHNHPRGAAGTPFAGLPFVCPQHLRRDRGTIGNFVALSDHTPVILDVGQATPRCMPLPIGTFGSEALVFGAGASDVSRSDTIRYAGNVQWFFINEKGTYSIDSTSNTRVEVYGKHDLSVPKHDFMGLTNDWTDTETNDRVSGPVYAFDDPPYYVKVTARSSVTTFPATYKVYFHKHGCTNPTNDYCLLKAGALTAMPWPDTALVSYPDATTGDVAYYQDQAYFLFAVTDSTSGRLPEIDFRVFHSGILSSPLAPDATGPGEGTRIFRGSDYDFSRCDCNEPGPPDAHCAPLAGGCNEPIAFESWDPWAATASPAGLARVGHTLNATNGTLFPDQHDTAQKHFLRVARAELSAFNMALTYLTNMTSIRSTNVTCELQNDSFGDDDIWVHVMADSSPLLLCADSALVQAPPWTTNLGEFDTGTGGPGEGEKLQPMRYVQSYEPQLCEDDSGANGNNDTLETLGPDVLFTLQTDISTPVDASILFADEADPDDRDYSYHVDYTMVHDDETLVLQ